VDLAKTSFTEISLAEVRSNVFVLLPPLVPRLDTLLQDLEMLWVRHRARLPLWLLACPSLIHIPQIRSMPSGHDDTAFPHALEQIAYGFLDLEIDPDLLGPQALGMGLEQGKDPLAEGAAWSTTAG